MADIRIKDLTEAAVPGGDYYLLTDSAADGPKKIKPSNIVTAADIGAATLAGVQTLTNKTISGSSNTLTNIPNAALTNPSITISGTAVPLGGSKNLSPADLGTVADSTILSNISGSSASASANTIASVIDKQLGVTRGSIAYRGAAGWTSVPPGVSGQYLKTLGPGTDPIFDTPAGGGDMLASIYDSGAIGGNAFDGLPTTNRTALKTLNTAKFSAAYLKEVGRAGAFVWRAGDYSSQVASDSQEAAYVKATAIAATAGAWVRQFNGECAAEWFGVLSDGNGSGGGTNNATALQAALNFCGTFKRPLRLLPGTYRSDSSLTVPAGVEIMAKGAVLDFKNAGNVTGLLFVSGGSISGATILGSGNATLNTGGVAIGCYGVNNAPSAPTYVSGPIIRDCIIDGWAGYGVLFTYTNRGIVTGCKITNIAYGAVSGLSANDMIVDGNLIDGVTPGTVDAYGVVFSRLTTTTETADPRSYRCKAVHNTIRNVVSVSGDNAQALNTHAGVEILFANNTVEDCEVGCIVGGANNSSGVPSFGPQRCTVRGNVFSSISSYVGVGTMVSGAINGSSVNDWAEGCVVEGNIYLGYGISGNGTSGAVIIQGSKGTVVQGNTLRWSRCNSIRVGYTNVGFNVSGNTIIDPNDGTYTVPAGIYVSDVTNRGYIGGNAFYFESGGLNTYVSVQSIRIESGLSGLDIEIDRCSFAGLDSTHLSYSEGSSTGVNAAGLLVQRGTATVALPSPGSGVLAVTFPKRFPSTPRVTLQRTGTPVPGTVAKPPILETDTKSATGFTIIARPYDLTDFGGTGNLTVEWVATT